MNKKQQGRITSRTKTAALTSTASSTDAVRATIAIAQPSTAPPDTSAMPGTIAQLFALLRKYFVQLVTPLLSSRKCRRKLQLLEMQQLGERRFVAIVRVGQQKFLIGGAASSVLLLAEISSRKATVLPPHPLSQESA